MPAAIAISQDRVNPEVDHPRPERRLNGNPARNTWNCYTNSTGEVFAGIWSSEVGSWRIEMGPAEDEFFFVSAGSCRLTDEGGTAVTASAGQSLLIPAGFKGVFEVLAPMQKHYMIVERQS